MRVELILILLIFASCGSAPESEKNASLLISNDSAQVHGKSLNTIATANQKYLKQRKKLIHSNFSNKVVSINDKMLKIPFDIKEKYGVIGPDFALFDFNKDGYNDLFFEYYGLAGTGEKNVIDIYFYAPTEQVFSDSCFTIINPSYFYEENMITSYYYGLGGGSAQAYQIKDGKIELYEAIRIDMLSDTPFEAIFSYSQKPFIDTIITKDDMVRLPTEYRYRRIIMKENTL